MYDYACTAVLGENHEFSITTHDRMDERFLHNHWHNLSDSLLCSIVQTNADDRDRPALDPSRPTAEQRELDHRRRGRQIDNHQIASHAENAIHARFR